MRRHVPTERHLHGQRATLIQKSHQSREKNVVIGHPLQRRVRENEIRRHLRIPRTNIGFDPFDPTRFGACLGEHLGGVVDPDHPGVWPPVRQKFGQISGAATEIVDQRGIAEPNPVEKFKTGAAAVIVELLVERGIPGGPGHLPTVLLVSHRRGFLRSSRRVARK